MHSGSTGKRMKRVIWSQIYLKRSRKARHLTTCRHIRSWSIIQLQSSFLSNIPSKCHNFLDRSMQQKNEMHLYVLALGPAWYGKKSIVTEIIDRDSGKWQECVAEKRGLWCLSNFFYSLARYSIRTPCHFCSSQFADGRKKDVVNANWRQHFLGFCQIKGRKKSDGEGNPCLLDQDLSPILESSSKDVFM